MIKLLTLFIQLILPSSSSLGVALVPVSFWVVRPCFFLHLWVVVLLLLQNQTELCPNEKEEHTTNVLWAGAPLSLPSVAFLLLFAYGSGRGIFDPELLGQHPASAAASG